MKKFKFSFQAVLNKREQEEQTALRELATHVAKLNGLHAEEQTVRANLRAWQEDFKYARPVAGVATGFIRENLVLSNTATFIRSSMQNFLKELKQKQVEVEATVRLHHQKVLQRRLETQKIELLREQRLKAWKRAKNHYEELQLQEQILQQHGISSDGTNEIAIKTT